MNEFSLIQRYFTRPTPSAVLGIGDDAALIAAKPGYHLAVAADMLVAGRHFHPEVDPETLGHKAFAVNLSDMAAMGANPRWVLFSIALPQIDERWVQRLMQGFFALADQYQVELIGGDTTCGPLNLSLQILGEVPINRALRRSGAKPGDDIWVSGTLGDAALALADWQGKMRLPEETRALCAHRLHLPEPRVALGLALQESGLATAAIDLSDGLTGDLAHILTASGVGATVNLEAIPRSSALADLLASPSDQTNTQQHELAQWCLLAGGDDYELCFTAAPRQAQPIEALSQTLALPLTKIGAITAEPGLMVWDQGKPLPTLPQGFDHFANTR